MPPKKKINGQKSLQQVLANDMTQLNADNLHWELLAVVCDAYNVPGLKAFSKKYANKSYAYNQFVASDKYLNTMSEVQEAAHNKSFTDNELIQQINCTSACILKLNEVLESHAEDGQTKLDELFFEATIKSIVIMHNKLLVKLKNRLESFYTHFSTNITNNKNSNFWESVPFNYFLLAQESLKNIQLLECLEKKYKNAYQDFTLIDLSIPAYAHLWSTFRINEIYPEKRAEIEKDLITKIKSLKNKLQPWQYYSALATSIGNDNLAKTKFYFLKARAAALQTQLDGSTHFNVLMSRSSSIGHILFLKANQLDDNQKFVKLELLKEAIFYLEMSVFYNSKLLECEFGFGFSAETEKLRIEAIQNFAYKALGSAGAAKIEIFRIKQELLSTIKSDFLIFVTNDIESIDDELRVKPCVKIVVKLPEYALALMNLCHAQAINCRMATDPETNVVSIIIPDLIPTSLTKLETAISHWHKQLPKPKSVEQENLKIAPVFSEDKITQSQVVVEQPTNTAAKKSKKKKKLADPSTKEQIKVEQAQKSNKPVKKITWAGTMNQPGYTYDESDKNCKVYRLYGDSAKRHYVYIDPRLYAELANDFTNELTILENLCINGTVLSHSRGHSCFISSGEPFAEQTTKLDLDYSDGSIEKNKVGIQNNANNANLENGNNNASAAQAMSITFLKGKNAGNQVRFFGSTERVTVKNGKTYNLVRIHSANITK